MSDHHSPIAYLRHRFVPVDQAQLPVWDRGVVQAATVTEMIRTFRGSPFRLSEHLLRLRSSLCYLQVEITESDSDLSRIVDELVVANSRRLPPRGDLGIVILVTAGSIPMYAGGACSTEPTVCIHTFPLPFQQWATKYTTGQSLVVPSMHQVPFDILPPYIKHRSRLHWYLADREAQATDPGSVALLATAEKSLTETNSGNFYIVNDGVIVTPRPEESLPGISQSVVRELAMELSIPYEVRRLTIDVALQTEEAFVTSTTYCVLPVTRINCQPIGTGLPGQVTKRLLAAWSDRIGFDIVAQATEDGSLP